MTWLLIDNYDSYTYNLFQLIAETTGREPIVLTNDSPELLADQLLDDIEAIVISPGPGRPQVARDLGHVPHVLEHSVDIPTLGVCMGHQAIAYTAGAQVVHAQRPLHGHLTTVEHLGTDLFMGVPQNFVAVRYHSLCVATPLPDTIEAIAWAEDGVIMGLRHTSRPQWGVQFHPESIESEFGSKLIANFAELGARHNEHRTEGPTPPQAPADDDRPDPVPGGRPKVELGLVDLVLHGAADTEEVFERLFGDSEYAFWLDSSRVESGLSRFSFLGDANGPLSEILSYRVADRVVLSRDADGVHAEAGSIFDILDRRLADRKIANTELPFDFTGGYVGYFGYEMKGDTGAASRHSAPTPDAIWMFADRLIAVDHEQDRTYVLALHRDDPASVADARSWVNRTAEQLIALRDTDADRRVAHVEPVEIDPEPFLVRPAESYVDDIRKCQRSLVNGESYEICLTNRVRVPYSGNDFELYRRLRACNPAPYSALLKFGDITVFCSSPERFLKIDRDRTAESKPIKGTARRDADPLRDQMIAERLARDPKSRAENLMIVDLLRNDLGRVSQVGSVSVPTLMAVESYSTVHQLVSTVRAELRDDVTTVQCVRHCFPGGSMTGAPKLRTMAIIDDLETEARGIYSGALGYFGLTGAADLNIVIRTVVRFRDELAIGAGGAIVLDSSPEDELAETLLKAQAPLRALPQQVFSQVVGEEFAQ